MRELIASASMCAAVLFAHWKFVILWFDDYGGLKWYWRDGRQGLLLTVGRVSFGLSVICALLVLVPHISAAAMGSSVVFFIVHYVSMALLSDRVG
jgi:hypothetical protein